MDPARRDRLVRRYREAAEQGKNLTLSGSFAEALAAYADARFVARELDDATRMEHAALNISMVLIQLGRAQEGEDGLREILLRTTDSRTTFSAAYNLAAALRKQGRHAAAWKYANRALDAASTLGARDLEATCYNLCGNIRLSQNLLDDAMQAYDRAVEIHRSMPDPSTFSLAILEENIGYCLLMDRRFEEGRRRLRSALKLARDAGDRRCEAECHQDLCYAYLMEDRHAEALEHGVQAFRVAQRRHFEDIEENCHYLLGELGSRMEDPAVRDRHFDALQDKHPELPFLKEFLCSVDVTRMITLKR